MNLPSFGPELELKLIELEHIIFSAASLGVGATTALLSRYYLGLSTGDTAKLTATTIMSTAAIPLFMPRLWISSMDGSDSAVMEFDTAQFAVAAGLTYGVSKLLPFDAPVGAEVLIVSGVSSIAGQIAATVAERIWGEMFHTAVPPSYAPGPYNSGQMPGPLAPGTNNMSPPTNTPVLLPGGTNNMPPPHSMGPPSYAPGPVTSPIYFPGPYLNPKYAPGPYMSPVYAPGPVTSPIYSPGPILQKAGSQYSPGPWLSGK